jgi:hypothetical protein
MRTIQTFILRLFVDTDAPEMLRGALQNIAERQTYPFADEQALLVVLRQIARLEHGFDIDSQLEHEQEKPALPSL